MPQLRWARHIWCMGIHLQKHDYVKLFCLWIEFVMFNQDSVAVNHFTMSVHRCIVIVGVHLCTSPFCVCTKSISTGLYMWAWVIYCLLPLEIVKQLYFILNVKINSFIERSFKWRFSAMCKVMLPINTIGAPWYGGTTKFSVQCNFTN